MLCCETRRSRLLPTGDRSYLYHQSLRCLFLVLISIISNANRLSPFLALLHAGSHEIWSLSPEKIRIIRFPASPALPLPINMARSLLSVPCASIFVTILAVMFGTGLWLHTYAAADMGSRLFEASIKDVGSRVFEASLQKAKDCYNFDVFG